MLSNIYKGVEVNISKSEIKELSKLQNNFLEFIKMLHDIMIENNIKYSLIWGSMIGAARHQGFIPWDDDMDIAMTLENYLKLKKIIELKNDNRIKIFDWNSKTFARSLVKIEFSKKGFKNNDYPNCALETNASVDIVVVVTAPKSNFKARYNILKTKILWTISLKLIPNVNKQIGSFKKKMLFWFLKPFIFLVPIKFVIRSVNKVIYKKYKSDRYYMPTSPFAYKLKFNYELNTIKKSMFNDVIDIKFENYKLLIMKDYDWVIKHAYSKGKCKIEDYDYKTLPPLQERKRTHNY